MALGDQVYAMREVAWVPGMYEHHGIDCGDESVIHYYKGSEVPTVTRTPRELFARGGRIFVKPRATAFLPHLVVQRAESRLGEQRYDLLTNNCEHFANWCKTGRSDCEQLAGFGLQIERYNLPDLRRLIEGTARDRTPGEAMALFHQALGNIAAAHHTLKANTTRPVRISIPGSSLPRRPCGAIAKTWPEPPCTAKWQPRKKPIT